jgi:hypothetical protein
MRAQRKKDIILCILACAVLCMISLPIVLMIIQNPASFQSDFKRYYFAGKLSLLGENPYDFGKMVSLFGDQLNTQQPFLYPPYTLILFRPLSQLSLLVAYYLFFTLKLIMYVLLFTMWKRVFFKDTSAPYFALFILASMGSEAAYLDLIAGNISVFQQMFFWAGIAYLLKKKIMASGICIVCASSIKFFVLSPLLLIFLAAGYWRQFLMFVGMLAALIVGVCIQSPTYFSVIKENIQNTALKETGHRAISIRNYLQDLFSLFHNACPYNPDILYGAIAICIAACSLYIIVRNLSFLRQEIFLLVNFTIISYCAVVPLLKDYEQLILIPPTFFLLDYFHKKKHRLMEYFLVLLYFVFTHLFLATVTFIGKMVGWDMYVDLASVIIYSIVNYHVLFTLCVTWIVYLFVIQKEKKGAIDACRIWKENASEKVKSCKT